MFLPPERPMSDQLRGNDALQSRFKEIAVCTNEPTTVSPTTNQLKFLKGSIAVRFRCFFLHQIN